MMNHFLRDPSQFFLGEAGPFVNEVDALFPNVGNEQIRYAPEIVCVLMVFLVCFFVGILWQFLCVFFACYLALVVYNNHGRMFGFVGWMPYQPARLTAEEDLV